ncbi:MAG: tyrosine-type recombinase/integrase [Ilumatobacter sp.]|nr:tyrosine-type recombinase/integrase [Ilumatobacter sp.]
MDLLDSWSRHLRAKNRSQSTIDSYRADVMHLVDHLSGKVELEDVTARQIEDFLAASLDRGLAPATVARRYRSLQQLYRWLVVEGEVDANPMANMDAPTVPVQPPDVLTGAEITALLDACRDRTGAGNNGRSGPFEARRDTAMVLLLVTTGIRASELIGLTVDDIHFNVETFRVLGKGGRERSVTLLPQPAEALDRYLRARRKHAERSSPALWLGEKGPLTDSGLRQMLERRSASAGIRRVNPHLFRHTFAHLAKKRGMADEQLMAIAGWNTTQMLQRYGASATAERAREAHRTLFGDDRL